MIRKEKGEQQEPIQVTKQEIKRVVRKLKNRKAGDMEGWSNELLKEGGDDMIEALREIFNTILRTQNIPHQWEKVQVKSIYKNKGKRTMMKNRRGIFLTSIIGKVFEKVLLGKTINSIEIDRHQNGGLKERSTKGNWLAMMSVIDKNRELNKSTYVLFADAEKCFDRLWLEDCLVDLTENGMREKEADILHKLNRRAEMVVETPVGETESFEINNIVKQGTIFGPILCCSSTAKINNIGERVMTAITPEMSIGSLIYVDDIGMAGKLNDIEQVGKKLEVMEQEKKFTFNIDQ